MSTVFRRRCLGGKADDGDADLVRRLFEAVGKIYRQVGLVYRQAALVCASRQGWAGADRLAEAVVLCVLRSELGSC